MNSLSAKIVRDIFFSLLLCGATWAFFLAYIPATESSLNLPGLSIENEEKLGEMMEESMASGDPSMHPWGDVYADSCVKVIVDRMLQHLDSSKYTYEVKVITSDEVNAFAIAGGKIFVCRGLLSFATCAEEVAAVVAHEMGHVEHRHVVNKMIKEVGISVLIGFLTDGNSGFSEEIVSKVMSSYFDREQETEADMFALKLLENSGINPSHLSAVFARMDQHFGSDQGPEFLSTHPALEERVNYTGQHKLKPGFVEVPIQLDWKRLRE